MGSPAVTPDRSTTDLIGRDADLERVDALLRVSRAVTLLGPPGIGKTTLAHAHVAARAGHAVVVEIGGTPGSLVTSAVGAAVGAAEGPRRTPVDAIAARVRGRRTLLVLDGCESLIDELGALVAALLEAVDDLSVLATSRAPLRVPGEVTMIVPPLERDDAIKLFEKHRPDVDGASDICERLGGIPLAIQLAAANAYDGAQADDPFAAAVETSLARLTEDAARLLRSIAVCPAGLPRDAFASDAPRDALEVLLDASLVTSHQRDGVTRYLEVEPIRNAVDERMSPDARAHATRLRTEWVRRVLTGLRQALGTRNEPAAMGAVDAEASNVRATLAWALFDANDVALGRELAALLGRYWIARGALSEADTWLTAARGSDAATPPSVLTAHGAILVALGNVTDAAAGYEAAIDAAREDDDRVSEAIAVAGVAHTRLVRGEWGPAADGFDEALAIARATGGADDALLGALHGRATVARISGDYAMAERLHDDALAVARRRGDRRAEALALLQLGGLKETAGELEAARHHLEASIAAASDVGFDALRAAALGNLGNLATGAGDYDEGRRLLAESLEITRRTGDVRTTMITLFNLATTSMWAGDHADAKPLFGEALEIAKRLGDKRAIAWSLNSLGDIAIESDDLEGAATLLRQAIITRRQLGDKRGLAIDLESSAAFASRRSEHVVCARLLGAADAHRDHMRAAREPMVAERIGALAQTTEQALGAAAWTAARDAGRALPFEEAVGEAERLLGATLDRAERDVASASDVPLAIRTLGGFAVSVHGDPVAATAWQSRKARDLVKVLISRRGRPVPRDTLVELLWPGVAEDPARLRSRLSVVLSTVRSVFGDVEALVTDRENVALDVDVADVDVERFLRAVARGDLEDAATLYTGEFLPEDVYADWTVGLREEARLAFVSAARGLATIRAERGDDTAVIALSTRILDQDPYDDEAHRCLVKSLVGAGRHGDARRAYELFARRMAELGLAPPSFETLARP